MPQSRLPDSLIKNLVHAAEVIRSLADDVRRFGAANVRDDVAEILREGELQRAYTELVFANPPTAAMTLPERAETVRSLNAAEKGARGAFRRALELLGLIAGGTAGDDGKALAERLKQCAGKLRSVFGSDTNQRQAAASIKRARQEPGDTTRPARHSPDFRSVHWYGNDFVFTATQAACVRLLWDAWEQGTPDVGGETLLEAVGVRTSRLVDIFRDRKAWGTLIRRGDTKGSYRLSQPNP